MDEEAKIVKSPDGKLRFENFYTPLEEAKKEIQRRWHDEELKKRVENYLGDIPEIFQKRPKAVLFRNIATPDFEFQHMGDIAQDLGLKPLYLEYLSDKFCTRSLDKLYLGRMSFFHCRDKNNGCVVTKRKLFDLKENDGKTFKDVRTYSGENIIDFHHRLFRPLYPDVKVFDISRWIKAKGKNALENYPHFLSLFLRNAVLLEAYNLDSSEERNFAEKVIIPSFNKVLADFKLKPLVVKLFNKEEIRDLYWYCHPQFLLQLVDKDGFQNKKPKA